MYFTNFTVYERKLKQEEIILERLQVNSIFIAIAINDGNYGPLKIYHMIDRSIDSLCSIVIMIKFQ